MPLVPTPLGVGAGEARAGLRVEREDRGMDAVVMETEAGLRLMCAWFVMCDRPAEWAAEGLPGQGMVPVCQRCADRVGMDAGELYPYELDGEG